MPASPPRRPLRLRLTAPHLPGKHQGRPTEFGLVDLSGNLEGGVIHLEGPVTFTVDLEVSCDPETGAALFHSPFLHGTAAAPYLCLCWWHRDEPPSTIRQQEIALDSITWKAIDRAPLAPVTFAAEVPAIEEQAGAVPVEWSLIDPGPPADLD